MCVFTLLFKWPVWVPELSLSKLWFFFAPAARTVRNGCVTPLFTTRDAVPPAYSFLLLKIRSVMGLPRLMSLYTRSFYCC